VASASRRPLAGALGQRRVARQPLGGHPRRHPQPVAVVDRRQRLPPEFVAVRPAGAAAERRQRLRAALVRAAVVRGHRHAVLEGEKPLPVGVQQQALARLDDGVAGEPPLEGVRKQAP